MGFPLGAIISCYQLRQSEKKKKKKITYTSWQMLLDINAIIWLTVVKAREPFMQLRNEMFSPRVRNTVPDYFNYLFIGKKEKKKQ